METSTHSVCRTGKHEMEYIPELQDHQTELAGAGEDSNEDYKRRRRQIQPGEAE